MEQIYTRKPIPAIAKAKKPTKASRITELLAGDLLIGHIVQPDQPLYINTAQAANKYGCAMDTIKRALRDLVALNVASIYKEYSAGNFSRSYNLSAEAIESPYKWKTFVFTRQPLQADTRHIQNEDTAAQLDAFNRITVDWRTAAEKFIQRKIADASCSIQANERKAWGAFYGCKSPAQVAQQLDSILTFEDTKEGKAVRLEIEFRLYQLDELARGTAEYYAFEHEKTGRIYSTFTQIPREFRSCLRVHHSGAWNRNSQPAEIAPYFGQAMREIDVKASQIALLSALLDRGGINASQLKEDTSAGKFHTRMMEAMNIDQAQKNSTYKPALFHWLYGFEYKEGYQPKRKDLEQLKRWNASQETRQAFAQTFAKLYGLEALAFIQMDKKQRGYKALPIELQKMEAAAIIKRAARRVRHLYPQAPVITCHDSIIVPEDEGILTATAEAIKYAYSKLYGLEVSTNYTPPEKTPQKDEAQKPPPTDWEKVEAKLREEQRAIKRRNTAPEFTTISDHWSEIVGRLHLRQSPSDESRRTPPHEY